MKRILTSQACEAFGINLCQGVFLDTFLPKMPLVGLPYTSTISGTSIYYWCRSFTGKERDEETGYGYFGARYMDHELMTMWLSVDPMADKYPGISPYAYCAWNPVKLVDPDGREIKFDPESEEIVQKFEERIENKKTETTCTPEARAEYDAALAEIKKLRGSDQMYHIEQGSSGNYSYSGGTSYDLGNNRVSITYNGSDASLAHELKHAYQFETGKLSFLTSTGASWDAVLYDVTDEYDAFERARAFGGEKVTMDYLEHRYKAPIHDSDGYFYPFKNPPEKPKENDHNIYRGKNTVRSLKADTNPNSPGLKGNIFRLNGVTYIK